MIKCMLHSLEVIDNMENEILSTLETKMGSTTVTLRNQLKSIRTGRASAHFLDPVMVEVSSDKKPILHLATVSITDAQTLKVQPWDTTLLKVMQKAIVNAQLGLTSVIEDKLIKVSIPPLSGQRRKELVKIAKQYGEKSKVSIRNIRRKALEQIKVMEKSSAISKDECKKILGKVQKYTNNATDNIDQLLLEKERDILSFS